MAESLIPDVKPTSETESPSARLFPLDALRGLIIVLMALDHANYFVAQQHSPGEYWGGPFPVYGDVLSFLTRLATHLAAPGFFFLMGVGMVLFANARRRDGWSVWAILGHFWVRGILLMVLQLLVVNRAWEASTGGWVLKTYIGVLFALGGTMILGSLLVWLRSYYLLIVTAVVVLGTAMLTPQTGMWAQSFPALSRLAMVPGGSQELWVNYPVLPWLGLVTFGMAFGGWLREDRKQAYRRALWLGVTFLVGFVLLRLLDGFGNIRPRAGDGWIDFLNVVKYPPSITFMLLTTGANLIILGLFAKTNAGLRRILSPLVVFGRVPLFFYLLHLFLYAGLGHWFAPQGTGLFAMYAFWLLGLVILYPLCFFYGRFKHRQSARSIWRFF